MKHICPTCKTPFQTRPSQIYCGRKCWAQSMSTEEQRAHLCVHCGQPFIAPHTKLDQQCCSYKCAWAYERAQAKPRFWSQVKKQPGPRGCWLWTGKCHDDGYGIFTATFDDGTRIETAHRYSYTIHHGPIPKGFHSCHKCNTPGCVRGEHLYADTNSGNARYKRFSLIHRRLPWWKVWEEYIMLHPFPLAA